MIGIAWAALFLWPVVAIAFYRNLSLPAALSATLLGGYLLLPSALQLDLPVLPALNKFSIPNITALVLTAIAVHQSTNDPHVAKSWIPQSPVIRGLLIMLFLGALGTVMTNLDPLYYGPVVLRGHSLYDVFAMFLWLMMLLLPLLLGRMLLSSKQAQTTFLKMLVVAGLVYSIPALWEVRMSPQLHVQLYGYFPSSFMQQVRANGFRPVVFLNHGLALAVFFTFAAIGAAALARATMEKERLLWLSAVVWLLLVLLLCKSFGPLIILMVLLPVTLLLNTRMQLIVSLGIAGLLLTYPILRSADVVPVYRIIDYIATIDPARATSFKVRVDNEEMLLGKALERPWFGWGVWGRQRLFDEYGRDLSITDGSWVLSLGSGGWARYIGIYGLLCWPIIVLFFRRREKADAICMGLVLVLCVKLVDLIPNPAIGVVAWMCVGGLIGRLESESSEQAAADTAKDVRTSRYAREFPAPEDKASRERPADLTQAPGRTYLYRRPNPARDHRR